MARRVLVAKIGLDGHDRGARLVARLLRDAGYEVIYTGIRQTVEMVVATAEQEDVDLIGLSVLSGAHMPIATDLLDQLNARGLEHIAVVVGGIIPPDDVPRLEELGVKTVIGPGTSTAELLERLDVVLGGTN